MFAPRYFPPRYFAPRYWVSHGATVVGTSLALPLRAPTAPTSSFAAGGAASSSFFARGLASSSLEADSI